VIWTATCGYCGAAGAAEDQADALDALGADHFDVEHEGVPARIAWTNDQPPEESIRAAATSEIRSLLSASDVWAARHVEDGVSLTPDRIAYRQELRVLLASLSKATPKQLRAFVVPDPPASPAGDA
jgi:hypothetical protein